MLLIFIWGQTRKSFWQSVCTKAKCLWTPIYPKGRSLWMKIKQAGPGLILSGRQGAASAADADDGAGYRLRSPTLVQEEGKAPWSLWASKLFAPQPPHLQKKPSISAGNGKNLPFCQEEEWIRTSRFIKPLYIVKYKTNIQREAWHSGACDSSQLFKVIDDYV